MLKEHKASMPRLSAKKPQLMEYATKFGLLKSAEPPPPPPVPEASVAVPKKKSATTVVVPASSAKKSELPEALKKPEAPKKSVKKVEAPAPAKKAFSEGAKSALNAYTSFVAEKKARGMSHKDAVAAWKNNK
jgi:hypothetical protein